MAKDKRVGFLIKLTCTLQITIPGFKEFIVLNERLSHIENEIMTSFTQPFKSNNILIFSFQFGKAKSGAKVKIFMRIKKKS